MDRVVERERDPSLSRGVVPRPRVDEDGGGTSGGVEVEVDAPALVMDARDFERELPLTRSFTSLLIPRNVAASENRPLPVLRPRSDVEYGLFSATRFGASLERRVGDGGREEMGSMGGSGATLGSVLMTIVECEPCLFLRPCRTSCNDAVDEAALDVVERRVSLSRLDRREEMLDVGGSLRVRSDRRERFEWIDDLADSLDRLSAVPFVSGSSSTE